MLYQHSLRLAGVALAALALAGCDDEDPIGVSEPTTIAATASTTPDLSVLAQALQAANLVGVLQGDGPLTVFAPRDAAFDALGVEVVEGLLEEGNAWLLSRLLTLHVVEGAAIASGELADGQTVTTVEGGSLTFAVSGGGVTVNGANVVTADIEATNGIVHIIDAVLVPSDLDVYETAALTEATTDLASVLLAAGLSDDLRSAGPLTVFAPVNEAFTALGDYRWAVLNEAENVELLSKILTFHVVSGEVLAGDLIEGGTATTLEGGTLTFDLSDESDPKVNGVSITATDIEVGNGVIHLVDEVLLPELDAVETATLNIATATLVDAIVAAELGDALSADGPFTVFAPVNGAFERLGATTVQNLLDPANQAILQEILQYHVIPGDIRAADLSDGMTATTLEGGEISFDLADPTEPKVNGAVITIPDIVVGNGVIHIIDGVLTEGIDIVQRARVTSATSSLAYAIIAADLATTLQGEGPFTVFAPTDGAFELLGTNRLDVILDPANQALLQKILTYHVVPGDYRATDLSDGMTLTTVEGADVAFDLSDTFAPKINGVQIRQTDIVTENGVIHFIDEVVLDHLDVIDVATIERLPTLVSLIDQQGLTETLRSDNGGDGYTVFAPTEDAFAALAAVPTGQALTDVLLYHVVSGTIEAGELSDGQIVSTLLENSEFTVNVAFGTGARTITDGTGSTVAVNVVDIVAANGIIHVIDGVILPR